jgi:hypothetical protein
MSILRSEADTRQQLIDCDPWLAGWDLDDPTHVSEVVDSDLNAGAGQVRTVRDPHPYRGHQFVDYALSMRVQFESHQLPGRV